VERKYWIILGLGIAVILYLRRRVAVESSPQALNTMAIKAATPTAGTGYYTAGDLGHASPFANGGSQRNGAGTLLAGSTLVVDITPVQFTNNLPYDPAQSEIVI